jgi:hypothetical protein
MLKVNKNENARTITGVQKKLSIYDEKRCIERCRE